MKQGVTFFSKHLIICPSCNTEFKKEELQTGRGRLNASDLTPELRRMYIPTQKYGVVNPLLYPILVCPTCLLAGFPNEFQKFSSDQIPSIQEEEENRHKLIRQCFGKDLDFNENRDTIEGAASYILGFSCSIFLPKESSPTAKRGLYALRAAWLTDDLYQKSKLEHFKELRDSLYYQAYVNYDLCLERQLKNKEPFDGFVWMGPDVDTNFGYDGLLYIIAFLSMKHISLLTPDEQIIKIGNVKRVLSKIFGIGKSSKAKPQALVSSSRTLYGEANNLLSTLASKGLDTSIADEIENQEDDPE
ncbi:MAG: DUF2225 domain-containing protein [Brevinema sp.]